MKSGALRKRGRGASVSRVVSLLQVRIQRALAQRTRYRYVHPRVLAEGRGWKIVCANCSRNIDPAGGEIDIAWLLPSDDGAWTLHARDHGQAVWVARESGLALDAALRRLCADPLREYWQ